MNVRRWYPGPRRSAGRVPGARRGRAGLAGRKGRAGLAAAGLLVGFLLATAGPAFASHEGTGAPLPTRLRADVLESRDPRLPSYLVATLVADDGAAVAKAPVAFYRTLDFLGERDALLGRAMTDTGGVARIQTVPRLDRYLIRVVFEGTEHHQASELTTEIRFPASMVQPFVHPAHRAPHVDAGLQPVAAVMPASIGAIVVLVWVALLGLTGVTLFRIRQGAVQGRGARRIEQMQQGGTEG